MTTRPLLGKPSIYAPYCVVCGRPATNQHHVIIKGMGGMDKATERRVPTLTLCGMGNTSGCHGLAHQMRLHFRYRKGWECIITAEPCDYQTALESDGWRRISHDL